MRPIQIGLLVFTVAIVGLLGSVFAAISLGYGHSTPFAIEALLYIFGWTFFLSLPVAALAELVSRSRRKSNPGAGSP